MVSKFVDWRNTILNLRELRMGSTKITATSDEINQVCDGAGASATAANLTALTDEKAAILAAASGGGSGVQVSDLILVTSAELLDLHNTPKVLEPARGVGTCVQPLIAFALFTPGGTPYSTGGGNLAIQFQGNTNTALSAVATDSVFGQAAPQRFAFTPDGGNELTDAVYAENLPVVLTLSEAITLGNGTLAIILVSLVV